MELFKLWGTLALKDNEFIKGLASAGSNKEQFATKVNKIALAVSAVVAGMGVAAANVGMKFESAMSQVAATMGIAADKGDATFSMLSNLAKEMGATTKFSASQAADAINNMAMAGYNAAQITKALPEVLNLAAAGSLNLDYATQLAANGLNVMGLGVESLSEMSDKMAVTASSAYGSVADFGEGLLVAGGQAKLANLSLTDTFTALGILGDAGISAGEGGTYLRNTLRNLYDATVPAAEMLKKLGVDTATADGEMIDFQIVLQNLGVALDGLTDEERLKAMGQIFDSRTITAANELIAKSGERWDELSAKIDNSSGAAARMADTMQDNLAGAFVIIKSQMEGLAIQAYEKFQEPLRKAAEVASKGLEFLATNFDRILAVLTPVTAGFAAFVAVTNIQAVMSSATKAIQAHNTAMALMKTITAENTALKILSTKATETDAASEAVRTAIKKAGMTVTKEGIVLTAAGTVATEAEALAVIKNSGALTAKQVIVGLLTKQMTLAEAAQWLWNAAMNANPIGLVVAGTAALVAGIVVLVKWLNKESEEEKILKQNTEALAKANDKLLDSIESNNKAFEDSEKNIDANAAASKSLADKIYELSEVEEKSALQKQMLAIYVDNLNESMGETVLAYDAENDALSRTQEEISKLIDARAEQAKATAAQERAVEIAKEQFLVEERLVSIARKKAEAAILYGENTKKYNKAVKELNEQEAELITQSGALADSFDHMIDIQVETATVTDDVTDAIERQAVVMEAKAEAQQKALESLSKEYTTYADAATNMFDRLSDESKLTFDEMLENMQENQRVVGEWANNLATLSERGIDEGLLSQMKRMGPEGAGYVAELVKASDTELEELNKAFAAGGETSVDALTTVWGLDTSVAQAAANLATSSKFEIEQELNEADFIGIGKNVVEGLEAGIRDNAEKAVAAARAMAWAVEAAAKTSLDIRSPSKVFEKIGINVDKGFINGILGMTNQVSNAVDSVFGGLGGDIGFNAKLNTAGLNLGLTDSLIAANPQSVKPTMATVGIATGAAGSVTNNYYLQVDMDKVDDVTKLTKIFQDFAHDNIVYGGVS